MNVVESDVPSGSMLSRDVIEHAYFRDSYRAPLNRRDLGIVDVFFAIFAHHPLWMKLLLIVRNKIASFAGLDAPTASEITRERPRRHCSPQGSPACVSSGPHTSIRSSRGRSRISATVCCAAFTQSFGCCFRT